jgi:hypothetical protein
MRHVKRVGGVGEQFLLREGEHGAERALEHRLPVSGRLLGGETLACEHPAQVVKPVLAGGHRLVFRS